MCIRDRLNALYFILLKYDIEFRVYRPSFVPQFEVQVRSGSQLPAVAYQGNGFSAFYGVAFAFQQRAAMLVDGYEILVMLYLYQIAGFGCIGTVSYTHLCFMVDMGGNFYGYMGDMSRVFSIGKLPEQAYAAHQTCLEIQEEIVAMAKPGTVCEDMYNKAIEIVTKAGFADYFMGVDQKAKFIGHGIGLEINEMPVLAPRMKQELEPGMVFALEPKIVLPGIGPVGIENSWAVTTDGLEKLTLCKEEIIEL